MTNRLDLRLFCGAAGAALAWTLGDLFLHPQGSLLGGQLLLGILLGFLIGPLLVTGPLKALADRLGAVPSEELFVGFVGLGVGLILSSLIALSLAQAHIPRRYSWIALFLTVLITYVCLRLFVARSADVRSLLARGRVEPSGEGLGYRYILLDTSAIIDGRIADISQTGFISAELVVPRFVLDELQHIADSSDPIRRNRGRRGLDMLNKLRKESLVPIQVMDVDAHEVQEVDAKLVQVARSLKAPIVTQDANLTKVAELQGVVVLNVNTLAHSVKPLVLPGEEMAVHIIQSGRELNQGVGYLDDGTMIVVEDGQRYLNRDVEIIVTRVLQTVAGRMIFAHPKGQGAGSGGGR
ncbi:MAG: PIN/TRAM domain-containing protein [Chloroflexota bacterium]